MPYKDRVFAKKWQREYDRNRRLTAIKKMHDYLGGKCVVCNATERLEVHHIDPRQKSFGPVWTRGLPWAIVRAELDKCELRCFTHHKEVHAAKHGTLSRYTNNKCRCEACVKIYREYDRKKQARYRAERKEKASPSSVE